MEELQQLKPKTLKQVTDLQEQAWLISKGFTREQLPEIAEMADRLASIGAVKAAYAWTADVLERRECGFNRGTP